MGLHAPYTVNMDDLQIDRAEYLALPDEQRPHLYPGRTPSNSTYVGSRNCPGCRCAACKSEHARVTRESRKVLQIQRESVVDEPVPGADAESPASSAEMDAEALSSGADPSGSPQPSQAVYSEPVGTLTAEEVAARILKSAVDAVEPSGVLPEWMLMAEVIASKFGVPVKVAREATRVNGQYIAINQYLNGGHGAVALIKKPRGIRGHI